MAFNFRPLSQLKKPNLFNLNVPHANEFGGFGGALSTPSFYPNEFGGLATFNSPFPAPNPWHGQQSNPDRAFFPESGNIEYYYDSRSEDEGGSWRGYKDAPGFDRIPFLPFIEPENYGNLGQGDQNQLGKMPTFLTQYDKAQLKAEEIRQAEADKKKYERMMELATMGDDTPQAASLRPQIVGANPAVGNIKPLGHGPLDFGDDALKRKYFKGLYT